MPMEGQAIFQNKDEGESMQLRRLTEHEVSAVVIVTHVLQQCMVRKSQTVPVELVLSQSQVGPLDKADQFVMKQLMDAGLEHRLLGVQQGEIFVSQLGKVLLAFAEIARGTAENFEEQTRDHTVLNALLAAIDGDGRFSSEANSQTSSIAGHGAKPQQARASGNSTQFWTGVVIMALLAFWCIAAVLKR